MVEDAKFRINFTNLDALLRPQFIQLRASNPTFCVLKWNLSSPGVRFCRILVIQNRVSMQFQYQFSRETGRLLRETTHWFAPQFQPAEDVERTGTAVRAEGVDVLFGHRSDGIVAGLGRLPTGAAGVADSKN